MEWFKRKVDEATAYVRDRIPEGSKIGVLTGTGLGDSLECMEGVVAVDYKDIPHFPESSRQLCRQRFWPLRTRPSDWQIWL
jgi:purine-nucleoside phosphorylase